MRRISSFLSVAALTAVAVLATGCAGPEKKFGRGLANITEPLRLGELRRTMEQTAISEGPDVAYTRGFISGLNKTIARTAMGAYEIVTFPLPDHGKGNYDPLLKPVNPVYPDSYTPRILADPMFQPDSTLGFAAGDVAPWIAGSRFRIFD
jgi:putative exosortase-associated protein (TIGR04073 family)